MELEQEFHYAHPSSKIKINQIYNSSFYGSPLWNLFGAGAHRLESSYNRFVKNALDLPYATHRAFIEPLSGSKLLKIILIQRFLGFLRKVDDSKKAALIMLKNEAINDVRSITGKNCRNIMLYSGKSCIEEVLRCDMKNLAYHAMEVVDWWKVELISELINIRSDCIEVPGLEIEEVEKMIENVCTG